MFSIIDDKVLETIAVIKTYAESNRVNKKTLEKMAHYGEPGYNGPSPAGENPYNTMKIFNGEKNFFYKIAFSIEEMCYKKSAETLWVRHLSVSTCLNDLANEGIVFFLLPLFDFKSTKKENLYINYRYSALHILEPVDSTWKKYLERT